MPTPVVHSRLPAPALAHGARRRRRRRREGLAALREVRHAHRQPERARDARRARSPPRPPRPSRRPPTPRRRRPAKEAAKAQPRRRRTTRRAAIGDFLNSRAGQADPEGGRARRLRPAEEEAMSNVLITGASPASAGRPRCASSAQGGTCSRACARSEDGRRPSASADTTGAPRAACTSTSTDQIERRSRRSRTSASAIGDQGLRGARQQRRDRRRRPARAPRARRAAPPVRRQSSSARSRSPRRALPLIRKGRGRIVFTGSIGGRMAFALPRPLQRVEGGARRAGLGPAPGAAPLGHPGDPPRRPVRCATPIWDKSSEAAATQTEAMSDEARAQYGDAPSRA